VNAEELKQRFEPQTGESFEYERQLWQTRFSPCGKFLVGAGYDATVQRWSVDGDTYTPLPTITGHDGWVQCIGFTGHDDRLISADSWGRVSCWTYSNAEPQEPHWSVSDALAGWIRALDVSPDGKLVAIGGNGSVIRILSTSDGKVVREMSDVPDTVFSLRFHPSGKTLVSGDLKGNLREWDVASGEPGRVVEVEGLYQLSRIQECGGARHLAFDADGSHLVVGGQKTPGGGFATGSPTVVVFDWQSGERLHELVAGDTQEGFIYDTWFHPEGFVVGLASAFPGKGKLFFWQPGEDKPFFVGTKLTNGRSLSLHPDGRRLAFTISSSGNRNGRPLKDGEYLGGKARIQILRFPEVEEAASSETSS
jgi:WD40 repeat protein